MIRFLFSLLVFVFVDTPVALAATNGPNAYLQWTYAAADQARIEGFELWVNGAKAVTFTPDKRQVQLKNCKLVAGANAVKIRAYAGSEFSNFSNEVSFTYDATPLAVPGEVKITVTFTATKATP